MNRNLSFSVMLLVEQHFFLSVLNYIVFNSWDFSIVILTFSWNTVDPRY